jgi:hypothetical protein
LDIPDLFSHVKDVMKSQAEVTEDNPEKEIESQMTVTVGTCLINKTYVRVIIVTCLINESYVTVIVDTRSINEPQMMVIVVTSFINESHMMVIGRVGLA